MITAQIQIRTMLSLTGAQALYQTTNQFIQLDNVLRSVTKDSNAAKQEMKFLIDESNRLGLNIRDASKGFADLMVAARGTKLDVEGVHKVFTAFSGGLSLFGATTLKVEGTFRALTQMLSKGKVSAEELRNQLAEHFPGAMQIAARAMQVSVPKLADMMKKGLLEPSELLMKMATQIEKEYGPAIERAARTPLAAWNRLNNAWQLFLKAMADDSTSPMVQGMDDLTQVLKNLTKDFSDFDTVVAGVKNTIYAIIDWFKELGSVLAFAGKGFVNLAAAISESFGQGKVVITDWGDFVGYLFEVTLPSLINRSAEGWKMFMSALEAVITVGVNNITYVWEMLKISMQSVFQQIKITAMQTANAVVDAFVNEVPNFVNPILERMGSSIRIPTIDISGFQAALQSERDDLAAIQAQMAEMEAAHVDHNSAIWKEMEENVRISSQNIINYEQQLEDARLARKTLERTDENIPNPSFDVETYTGDMDQKTEADKKAAKAAKELADSQRELNRILTEGSQAIDDYILAQQRRLSVLIIEESQGEVAARRAELMFEVDDKIIDLTRQKEQAQRDAAFATEESARQEYQAKATLYGQLADMWQKERGDIIKRGDLYTELQQKQQRAAELSGQLKSIFSETFMSLAKGGESGRDVLKRLLESLRDLVIQMGVINPLMKVFSDLFINSGTIDKITTANSKGETTGINWGGILGSIFGSIFSSGTSTTPTIKPEAKALGDIVNASLLHGIYNSPTLFPMGNFGYHAFAKGVGLLGEAGPEAVMPLTRVNGKLGVSATSQQPIVNVNVNNTAAGYEAKVSQRDNEINIDIIRSAIADDINRGGSRISRAMEMSYAGLRRGR